MHSGPVIAVLGGGVIGMSIAWRLAQDGADVTLFEAGSVGNQSSWAGAGMLGVGGEFFQRSAWSELALESRSFYPEYIDELRSESKVFIDYRNCGAFDVAFSEKDVEALRGRAERQKQIGIYSEQFPASRIPGLRAGAVASQYFPDDAVVNPRDIMRALMAACARAGVKFRESTRITSVPLEVAFDRTVIAAGAWSSGIAVTSGRESVVLPESIPVRGHLVAFEEHAGLCDAIVRHNHTYLLRRANNLVIAGSSTEHVGFARDIDGAIASEIAKRAGELIPQLGGCGYSAWNGLRPGSASGHPVMGRVPNSSVWLAYGHYRNGILLAPAVAYYTAREVMGGQAMPASLQTDWLLPSAPPQ